MKPIFKSIILLCSTFVISGLSAQNTPFGNTELLSEKEKKELSFQLKDIQLKKVQTLDSETDPFDFAPQNATPARETQTPDWRAFAGGEDEEVSEGPVAIANGMLVLGQKIWKFVKDNEPVVNIEGAYAHIVPEEAQSWQELEYWGRPVSALYHVSYENLYGFTVVELSFRVTFTPRGSYLGNGEYIANLVVLPELVDVSWGYTVDAGAKIYEVLNRRSLENPLAAAQIAVGWTVKTVMKSSTVNRTLFVEGDGSITDLNVVE